MKHHPNLPDTSLTARQGSQVYTCLVNGIKRACIDSTKLCLVSDFLYQPDILEYIGINSFHIPRGRCIAFGTGMKLANPKLKIVAITGDLVTLGGNHFIHAARRNIDITVICMNNFIYSKIDGKNAPATKISFSPYANFERPVNILHVAKSCGAVYGARWTALHETELTNSIATALQKSGFSVIEVISPGAHYFGEVPDIENYSDIVKFYYENSVIKDNEDTQVIEITSDRKIIVGKFFERERPTYIDSYNTQLTRILGDKFKAYG